MFFLYLNSNLSIAQKSENINKMFVRVYDLEGNKIGKGRIAFINDSVIGLKRSSKVYQSFFIRNIGLIKTKKSAGHNVFKGALIGTGLGVAIAIAESEENLWPYSKGEAILALGSSGAFYGAAIGGLSALCKHSDTFIINGDFKRWESFKALVVH